MKNIFNTNLEDIYHMDSLWESLEMNLNLDTATVR